MIELFIPKIAMWANKINSPFLFHADFKIMGPSCDERTTQTRITPRDHLFFPSHITDSFKNDPSLVCVCSRV